MAAKPKYTTFQALYEDCLTEEGRIDWEEAVSKTGSGHHHLLSDGGLKDDTIKKHAYAWYKDPEWEHARDTEIKAWEKVRRQIADAMVRREGCVRVSFRSDAACYVYFKLNKTGHTLIRPFTDGTEQHVYVVWE